MVFEVLTLILKMPLRKAADILHCISFSEKIRLDISYESPLKNGEKKKKKCPQQQFVLPCKDLVAVS